MRYSLVNRVRGIFLGAFLGENLARQNPGNLGNVAILGSKSLIAAGRLDLDDWLRLYQQASVEVETTETAWGKIILATLPVAIFFHEDDIKLKQNLQQVLQIWQIEPIIQDAALVIGYAIAQSLTEKLHPRTLIPQTISFLGKTPTSLPQNLFTVNSLLQQGAGLEQARTELSKQEELSNNIALAFYCFLSTLEDFRLAVLRATDQNNHRMPNIWSLKSQTISAITGALSGAYNSTTGIPVNWQVSFSVTKPAWGMGSFAQILELADALVGVWSGLYDLEPEKSVLSDLDSLLIFAAPRVIRPR
ncbi:ADP-ribosylglycohydrolase family protein [Anabaena sp. PCC 7108]|uniref:ADP-ribosylglycohydrolase family protein n=1 Tax=Anabaena sp. PCC 7108 TaxID=163908 RepID=UPI00034BB8A5|nr:ADP-ribosylglycohydrolase family protein [Anabaena sp. PCC 7108]